MPAERRRDPTNPPESRATYTHQQFVSFYGAQRGDSMWRRAGRAGTAAAERRRDPTDPGSRRTYTKAEFHDFYGAGAGSRLWQQAGSARPARKGAAAAAPSPSMDPDLVESLGRETVQTLARHFRTMRRRGAGGAVSGKLKPGELAKQFGESPPAQPTPFGRILRDVERKVLPGVTNWQHPNFMAYYPSATSLPAVMSDAIVASIGSVGLQWAANPIGTELEVVVMDWLAQMIGVGGPFLHRSGEGGGLIRGTAGELVADMCVCARIEKQQELLRAKGTKLDEKELREQSFYADSSNLVAYMSDQTHFCGPKAARVAGMRVHQIKPKLLADGNFGITIADVRAAMEGDKAKGLVPCFLMLNHGTTNTCGYDELEGADQLRTDFGVWVHVDGAYAGASWILPERHDRTALIQKVATSFNFNGSKWFLCGFDSAFYWVRDRRPLKNAFSASDVFMAPAGDGIYDPEFKDWSVPLGRRFRALRIWMVIEYFGVEGMRAYIRQTLAAADWLREQIDKTEGFAQAVKTDLGLVCVTAEKDGKDVTNALADKLKDEGKFVSFPSVTPDDRPHLRVALGGANTTQRDVAALWKRLQDLRAAL